MSRGLLPFILVALAAWLSSPLPEASASPGRSGKSARARKQKTNKPSSRVQRRSTRPRGRERGHRGLRRHRTLKHRTGVAGRRAKPRRDRAKERVSLLARAVYNGRVRPGAIRRKGLRPPRKSGRLIVVNKGLRPSPGRPHNSSIMLLNLKTGEVEKTLDAREGPHEVSVSPDNRTAVIPNYGGQAQEAGMEAGGGNSISILDLKRETMSHLDLNGYFRPHGVEWLDKRRVALTVDGTDKSIRQGYVLIVNVAKKQIEKSIPTGEPGSHLVKLAPNGRDLFVTNIQGKSLTKIQRDPSRAKKGSPWSSARKVKTIKTGEGAEGIALHPKRREVWVANQQANTITVVDRATLKAKRTIRIEGGPIRLRFTPDGKHAVASLRAGNALALLDAKSGAEVKRIPFEVPRISEKGPEHGKTSTPMMVEFHPNAPHIAYVGNSHSRLVSVVNLRRGEVTGYYKAGDKPDPLAWAPGK